MSVALVACGFNANGQLLPHTDTLERPPYDIPDDITKPSIVASGEKTASVLFAGWSDTLFEIDDVLYLRGADAHGKQITLKLPENQSAASPSIKSFGDHTGVKGILISKKDILLLTKNPQNEDLELNPVPSIKNVTNIEIAGNGRVCIIRDRSKVALWATFEAFASQKEPEEEFDLSDTISEIIELESNESAFAFLTSGGEVFTFGDPRHCNLGRNLDSPDQPANQPGIVDALDGVPIAHISSGGWITAALSRQEDLYIWGGRAGDGELIEGLENLDGGEVNLVDLGGGLDVKDVVVGEGHIVALTADGRVWAAGRGENGQVGTGKIGFQREWKELEGLPRGVNARKLFAGGWGTFIRFEEGE